MTVRAICYGCIHDAVLSARVETEGAALPCEACGEETKNAFSYEQLGVTLDPVLRKHYEHGPTLRKFYDDDSEGWEQDGELLSNVVQTVLGQDVEAPEELVSALADAENFWAAKGGEQFYDDSQLFIPRKAQPFEWMMNWRHIQAELAHRRRFFSNGARRLFEDLLQDVATVEAFDQESGHWQPVVSELPQGTEVSRARVVRSDAELKSFVESAAQELGAPPAEKTPTGRMNAMGITVFYGAMDSETCVAEMRPAIGGRVLVGVFQTTRPLRILDFRRLETATLGDLSYFDPNYSRQRERASFLRRLHGLISRPVVPGHEDEYLVTQTLAEYLAHVHTPPFDGIVFQSVQREGGENIVLFEREGFDPKVEDADPIMGSHSMAFEIASIDDTQTPLRFPVEFVIGSAKLFATRAIEYKHEELAFSIYEGGLFVHDDQEDYADGDWD